MGRKRLPHSAATPPLRDAAERRLATVPLPEPPAQSVDELLHELRVHQVELEMQNEALRQSHIELERSRDRYVDLYDFAPTGYLTLTKFSLIADTNLTAAELLRVSRTKLRNHRFALLVVPKDRDRWQRHLLSVFQRGGRQTCEVMLKRGDGSVFDASLDCMLCEAANGVPTVRMALTDISFRKMAEEKLRLAAVAFESQEGIIVTDPRGIILQVNRAFTRQTGFDAREAVGRTPALLKSGRQSPAFYQAMWQSLQTEGYWQGEIWNRRKSGETFAAWLTISAVSSPEGETTHYIGTSSEITKIKEAETRIHQLAYYDALTRLPNRSLLLDRIGHALSASGRSGHYGALIFLDLDKFKTLNDTRGHDVGDRLLIDVANRIQANVRTDDTVARLGGDEFVVMLENLGAEAEDAAIQVDSVAEKIRDAIARPFDLGDEMFHTTASFGVTLFRGQHETVATLLKRADMAMYKAKSAGRNTLRFYDPAMQTALNEYAALEADLRTALPRDQMRLFYQPQINGGSRVIGAEALLRWTHPERGLVLPGDFIPLAEESGLIFTIGKWVLETACAQIVAWSKDAATRDLRLAVNVSARQFRQPGFVSQIKQILTESGADPTRLKIELTESLIIENVTEVIAIMQAIKALGIGFSMDDFGTGYSSLSYLKRLPLDQLKIDQIFVNDLATDANDAAIVQTIVTMGRTLGLDVIAEGVETEVQLDRLRTFGCGSYQGFLFAHPLPIMAFEGLL
jgi:diguanylate cyclase (GGDEF)-like protein/PAS domain S-box-containing protein